MEAGEGWGGECVTQLPSQGPDKVTFFSEYF